MNAQQLLESLRWKADMVIINHDGERVWLKECFNQSGKKIGITDCCPEVFPCEWHAVLARSLKHDRSAVVQ